MNSFNQAITPNDGALSQNEIVQNDFNEEEFQEEIEENSELSPPLDSDNEEFFEKNIIMCNACQTFFFGSWYTHKCFGSFTKARMSKKRNRTINSDHKCESCGKFFSKAAVLQRHINTVHEGHKDYECETCGKSFYHQSELTLHHQNVHEGRRDHKCESCLKSFSQASDLKRHIRTENYSLMSTV